MIKFRYVNFTTNISEIVSRDNIAGNNLFICPNHRSLSALQEEYQNYTTLQRVEFLTMDDYKLMVIQSSKPLLKEDKRTLAFYASLNEEQKDFFHITGYFQSISLARRFFALFEELAEEMVSFEDVSELLQNRESYQQWQIDNFRQLLSIRDTFKNYITERGFSDLIFLKNLSLANRDFSDNYDLIIVVNQFYFTALEKELLSENKTLIYLQIPKNVYNEKKMCCQPDFNAGNLTNINTENIINRVFCDEFSLKYDLFSQKFQPGKDTIIDTGILLDHLTAYNVKISQGSGFPSSFQQSTIYRFFKTFQTLLSELIIADGKTLITLNSLITACSDSQFVNYYTKKADAKDCQEPLFEWIYRLAENNYKYLDLQMNLVNVMPAPAVTKMLKGVFGDLRKFSRVKDFTDFLTDLTQQFDIKELLTDTECRFSDTAQVYYRLLEDFRALAEIGIVSDWHKLMDSSSGFDFSRDLLRLFNDYTKAKLCRFSKNSSEIFFPEITALNNTRNLMFENIFIVDAIEGNLPPSRKTPFLLTENQRDKLGLKTYADIVLREKYYFLRLIAQAKNVTIYSRKQEKDATEVSSFVEELHLHLPHIFEENELPISYLLSGHCQNWLKSATPELPIPTLPDNFYALPFNAITDLRDNCLTVSPSNILTLIEQPFLYYINNMVYLREREISLTMDYSPRQLGDIIHETFNRVWKRLLETYEGEKVHHNFRYNQENYAERALENYLSQTPSLLLQKTYDHSEQYFQKIVKGFLIDSIKIFLQRCDDLFTDVMVKIIPENESVFARIELFKLPEFSVALKGRADLRIENLENSEKHIYDYKSGKSSTSTTSIYDAQLNMYQQLYYAAEDEIKKFIYFVTEQVTRDFSKPKVSSADLIEALRNNLKDLEKTGYLLGDKKALYEDEELTRRTIMPAVRNEQ